ncbi:cysteine hydrolase family protein [Streptomyces bicolor]|uniref:cysteine hydrolase family protein n=1 Tax=Streptomyces bicolor TaxID=66874 RepID=UPI000AAC4F72
MTCEELADSFRSAGATVVLIWVERPGVPEQPPGSGLAAGLLKDGDIEIVKRTIGGFQGTGLDDRLRERGVTTLVFGGIATNQPTPTPGKCPPTALVRRHRPRESRRGASVSRGRTRGGPKG